MDEDSADVSGYNVSVRKTRQASECSVSSQKFDEMLKELMKPMKDLKQNFDTDIQAVVEEFLTQAGLRQLDGRRCLEDILPNFVEVALFLQQVANIYCKKVDYLYIKVMEIVQSFGNNAQEDVNDPDETEDAERDNRRSRRPKPRYADVTDFELIDLDEATNICLKGNSDPKPLSVLAKNFIGFEPRVITENDVQIKDYKGDLIGVSTDFRCNWNTDQNGMLCDDLEFCDENEPLDMCSMGVTANTMSSPPDSGHCSDFCGDGHSSVTPVNSDSDFIGNDTFMSPISERDYPDLSTLLSSVHETTIADSTVAELTLVDPTLVDQSVCDSTLQNTVLELSVKCNKRKASDSMLGKNKLSKYDFQINLSETVKSLKLKPSCFELPKSMIMKVLERRKRKLKKLRSKIEKYDVNGRSLDSQYILDTFVLKSNGKYTSAWYRKEMLKELKVLSTEWEQDFLGFPDYDDKEDREGFIGFDAKETEISQRNYVHCKVLYNTIIAKIQESDTREMDDDWDSRTYHDEESPPNCSSNHECDNRLEAVSQRLTAEATLGRNSLICSQEQLEISQRVEEWHTSIRADLEKAERRKMFDLWSYSSNVLTSFGSHRGTSAPVVSFSDVMANKPKEDKARYFLATLMLANTQNVEIIPTDTVNCNDFNVRLLSMERRITEEEFNS